MIIDQCHVNIARMNSNRSSQMLSNSYALAIDNIEKAKEAEKNNDLDTSLALYRQGIDDLLNLAKDYGGKNITM